MTSRQFTLIDALLMPGQTLEEALEDRRQRQTYPPFCWCDESDDPDYAPHCEGVPGCKHKNVITDARLRGDLFAEREAAFDRMELWKTLGARNARAFWIAHERPPVCERCRGAGMAYEQIGAGDDEAQWVTCRACEGSGSSKRETKQ